MKAIWNSQIIEERSNTIVVEEIHYFPLHLIHNTSLLASVTHTAFPCKRVASYHSLNVNGEVNKNAA